MHTLHIATACILSAQQELLIVRKQHTTAWMLPGGKLDPQETASQALVRELQEELQITVDASALQWLGRFEALAANEPSTAVQAEAFLVTLAPDQTPLHAAEVAAIQWMPLHAPLPATLAPLLQDAILPTLRLQHA